jgi:hypothetical protein
MATVTEEEAFREEAERLKLLSKETQRELIGMYRVKARMPKLSKDERTLARRKAKALAKLLRLD